MAPGGGYGEATLGSVKLNRAAKLKYPFQGHRSLSLNENTADSTLGHPMTYLFCLSRAFGLLVVC